MVNGSYTEPTGETPQTVGLALVPGTRTVWAIDQARASYFERYS